MKSQKRRLISIFAALAVIIAPGRGVDALAQSDAMSKQMEMMKQMMMSWPRSMKKSAAAKGKYACYLKHSCSSCALKMGECPCGMNAAKDMPVCNECKGGWHAGDRAIPGKTADHIKTMPRMGM